jgi:hypothetical protein
VTYIVGDSTQDAAAAERDTNFPAPDVDLPANRLHERVDGAEIWLKSIGCNRLLAWRVSDLDLEIEVLVFETVDGARQALDKDSGNSRSKGLPGDEGWANAQVVYFRRGKQYCRVIADNREHAHAISTEAQRFDHLMSNGSLFR